MKFVRSFQSFWWGLKRWQQWFIVFVALMLLFAAGNRLFWPHSLL